MGRFSGTVQLFLRGTGTDMGLPVLVDVALSRVTVGPWRARTVAPVSGTVVEYGFGSGANLEFYPASVSRVLAVEPSDEAWVRAAGRIAAFGGSVSRVGLDAAALGIGDASVDHVVSTFTMCTIPDLRGAMREARRVLKPGGTVRFVEHARHPSGRVAAVQDFVQPLWGRLAGGCRLNRDVLAIIESEGFEVSGERLRVSPWLFPARLAAWYVGEARVVGP